MDSLNMKYSSFRYKQQQKNSHEAETNSCANCKQGMTDRTLRTRHAAARDAKDNSGTRKAALHFTLFKLRSPKNFTYINQH